MKLPTSDIERLREALAVAKVIDVELAVLADGKIMGVNDKRDGAIISELQLGFPSDTKVGIGRVDELTKRLALFSEGAEAELKANDRGEVTMITLAAGRSKVQFRCTSMSLLDRKYPKENADDPAVVVSFTKAEVGQLSRATKTLAAEHIVIKVSKGGATHVECSDSNNDQFALVLEKPAEFLAAEEPTVFTYRATVTSALLDAGARDTDTVDAVIGAGGSLTGIVRGHSLIIMPKATGD